MDVTALEVIFGPVPTGVTAVTATRGSGKPRGFGRPSGGRAEPAPPPLLHPREVRNAPAGTGGSAVRA
ncbi:hypothetical protein ACWDE0_11965 [Streptomyces sp. 900105755]